MAPSAMKSPKAVGFNAPQTMHQGHYSESGSVYHDKIKPSLKQKGLLLDRHPGATTKDSDT
jgi:hypothetical protein